MNRCGFIKLIAAAGMTAAVAPTSLLKPLKTSIAPELEFFVLREFNVFSNPEKREWATFKFPENYRAPYLKLNGSSLTPSVVRKCYKTIVKAER